jgi:hypothetical protein
MAASNAPKRPGERRRQNTPERGEWQPTEDVGWQHGDTPAAPEGLMPASDEAWRIWMGAWFAAHWTPDDLPGLRTLVRLYDQVERGEFQRANEVRLQMDTYGITPKGQQDRRWAPPVKEGAAAHVRQIKPRKLKAM